MTLATTDISGYVQKLILIGFSKDFANEVVALYISTGRIDELECLADYYGED